MVEKSTSKTLRSELKCFRIKCSPFTVQGLPSQAHLTSASCLKENTKIFLSTSESSISFITFNAFTRISLTKFFEKDLLERILPMRSFLEFSLDDGTTYRLILLLSRLSLAACVVIVSTISFAMTDRSKSQRTNREGERFEGWHH